jgi:hypothetical protein
MDTHLIPTPAKDTLFSHVVPQDLYEEKTKEVLEYLQNSENIVLATSILSQMNILQGDIGMISNKRHEALEKASREIVTKFFVVVRENSTIKTNLGLFFEKDGRGVVDLMNLLCGSHLFVYVVYNGIKGIEFTIKGTP